MTNTVTLTMYVLIAAIVLIAASLSALGIQSHPRLVEAPLPIGFRPLK